MFIAPKTNINNYNTHSPIEREKNMSDIGKAWVDGIREQSYSEVENREYHEKYSASLSKEFDERIAKLSPLLSHPRDERGGLWISAFDLKAELIDAITISLKRD